MISAEADPTRSTSIHADSVLLAALAGLEQAKGSRKVDPSGIAVLPFANLSGAADQEYFSDGISEELINALSRFRRLHVAARNASFLYKGRAVNPRAVADELGVRWIVEGSVRKAGNRVRVTTQLIDSESGSQTWSQRFDREFDDIFELQDDIVKAIVGAIPGELDRHMVETSRRAPTTSLTAFDFLLRGRMAVWGGSDLNGAIENLGNAIQSDPNFALAHAHMAFALSYSRFFGNRPMPELDRLTLDHASRAVRADGYDPEILYAVSNAFIMAANFDLADMHSKRAVELNPNDASAQFARGFVLAYLGQHEAAKQHFAQSILLTPFTAGDWRHEPLIDSLYMRGEYEQLTQICGRWMGMPPHMNLELAAAMAQLGKGEEARRIIEEYMAGACGKPDPDKFVQAHVHMCKQAMDREHWLDGYRKAGIAV